MRPTLHLTGFVLLAMLIAGCTPPRSITPTLAPVTPTPVPRNTTICNETWDPYSISPYVLAAEGYITDVTISSDDAVIAVTTSTGLYAYCADGLADAWYQPDSPLVHIALKPQPEAAQFLNLMLTPDRHFPQTMLITRDANTGQIVEEREAEHAYYYSPSYGPGGSYPWDERIYSFLQTTYGEMPIVKSVSQDASMLVVGQPNGTIEMWDVETQKLLDHVWDEDASDGYAALAFSPDGRFLVAIDASWGVTLWPIADGGLVDDASVPLENAEPYIDEIAFSADGSTIALGSEKGLATIWQTATGRRLRQVKAGDLYSPNLALSHDGAMLIAGEAYRLTTWDVSTGELLSERAMPQPGKFVYSLSVHPDGQTLAAATGNNIDVWDLFTRQRLHSIEAHSNSVRRVRFSPDGALLASASYDGTATWQPRCTFEGHETQVIALAWSPDGAVVATGDHAGRLLMWDPLTCDYLRRLRDHEEMVVDAVFSPNGKVLVTGSFDSMAARWNIAHNEIKARYETDAFAVEAVAWQPGSDSLALGLGGRAQVILWNPLTQEHEAIIGAPDAYGWVRSLAWSPDGEWLAAGIAREVVVWNAATHQHTTLTALGGFGEVWGLAWTPDGATLITGSTDGTIMLWDTRAFGED